MENTEEIIRKNNIILYGEYSSCFKDTVVWHVFLTKNEYFLILLGATMVSDERVEIALEALQDLKGVWNELLKIWEKIDELKEQPWLSVQPRKDRF